jgi:hypothetical protein
MLQRILLALVGLLIAGSALAVGRLGEIEIYDRVEGRYLPVYSYQGRYYVPGIPGHEYELVLRNRSGGRLLAVASVDGVNVISGETAAMNQSGYVLEPGGSMGVKGWRKSMGETASFYFTHRADSYAARTDRPFDVGVIGVAFFRERPPRPVVQGPYRMPESAAGSMMDKSAKLGTGHGRREESYAEYTEFQRASSSPDEVISIYYDSRRNLSRQGVLPWDDRDPPEGTRPQPFPGNFAPDPWR